MNPPARNAMWRFGYPNAVNYDDNELYCGGYSGNSWSLYQKCRRVIQFMHTFVHQTMSYYLIYHRLLCVNENVEFLRLNSSPLPLPAGTHRCLCKQKSHVGAKRRQMRRMWRCIPFGVATSTWSWWLVCEGNYIEILCSRSSEQLLLTFFYILMHLFIKLNVFFSYRSDHWCWNWIDGESPRLFWDKSMPK